MSCHAMEETFQRLIRDSCSANSSSDTLGPLSPRPNHAAISKNDLCHWDFVARTSTSTPGTTILRSTAWGAAIDLSDDSCCCLSDADTG